MLTKNISKTGITGFRRRTIAVALAVVFLVPSVQVVHAATSQELQAQINALNNQNASTQATVSSLQSQASSYQDAINKLQEQISSIEQAVAASQAKQVELDGQIKQNQNDIAVKKQSLGADIKAMYVDGTPSTIEMLATSNNLSDYVDKQEYRTRVQSSIQDKLKVIAALQAQLQVQKTEVEQLIAAQKVQNDQLVASQNQQSQLLGYNQSQQNDFNTQIASNKIAIVALQKEQYALNVRSLGKAQYGGTGSYPWADAVEGSGTYTWIYNGGEFDPLGWSYRNCTSYAFWRLAQVRGIQLPWYDFPSVSNSGGRIGYSIPDFRNLGYLVDHNPQGSTLAVSGAGPYGPGSYGHIMYIESSDVASAYVTQYNQAGDGRFSSQTIYPNSTTWFVHIP